jgi:hypothetical protein
LSLLVGTIANESAFDPCALGYYPRKWAIANGFLKPRRQGISYTKNEVLSVIDRRAAKGTFKKTGFDLGLCQLLTKFYKGPPEDLLTVSKGIEICASEMAARVAFYDTKRPWLYWRGKKTVWYDRKISKLAGAMGSDNTEI